MGRKKIEIKLIKNERLRNITYNKRKKGLMKKIVELTRLCGVKAKLELFDNFGNLVLLEAGQTEVPPPELPLPEDKVIVYRSEDYPEFKDLEKKPDRDSDEASLEDPAEMQIQGDSSELGEAESSVKQIPKLPVKQEETLTRASFNERKEQSFKSEIAQGYRVEQNTNSWPNWTGMPGCGSLGGSVFENPQMQEYMLLVENIKRQEREYTEFMLRSLYRGYMSPM